LAAINFAAGRFCSLSPFFTGSRRAKLAGSSRVYWQTHETNHTAMQLYDKVAERSGFIVYRKLF